MNRGDVLHLMFMSGAIGFIVGMNVPGLARLATDWWGRTDPR